MSEWKLIPNYFCWCGKQAHAFNDNVFWRSREHINDFPQNYNCRYNCGIALCKKHWRMPTIITINALHKLITQKRHINLMHPSSKKSRIELILENL